MTKIKNHRETVSLAFYKLFKLYNSIEFFYFLMKISILSNKMNEMKNKIKNHCTMKQVKYGTTG